MLISFYENPQHCLIINFLSSSLSLFFSLLKQTHSPRYQLNAFQRCFAVADKIKKVFVRIRKLEDYRKIWREKEGAGRVDPLFELITKKESLLCFRMISTWLPITRGGRRRMLKKIQNNQQSMETWQLRRMATDFSLSLPFAPFLPIHFHVSYVFEKKEARGGGSNGL